jgi:hypothetical protein
MSFRLNWLYRFHSLSAVLYPEESSGYVAMNLTTGWIG